MTRKNEYGLDLDKIVSQPVLSMEETASPIVVSFVTTWKQKSHKDIIDAKKVNLECSRCEEWMGAITPLDKKDVSITNPFIINQTVTKKVIKYQGYCVKCLKWAKKERARLVMLDAKRLKRGLEKDSFGYWRDTRGHYLCVYCERLQIHDDNMRLEDKVWYGTKSDICSDCEEKLNRKKPEE